MKILVTGFDPFGDDDVNPASLILDELPAKIGNHEIETRQIPTSAKRSRIELENLLNGQSFDAVICIGQAGGRPDVTLERVAINLDEFRIADNDGEVLSGQKICADGPDGFLSRLPLKTMVKHVQNRKIPASVSYSAGTFVCNHIFYLANYILAQQGKNGMSTFIHVPYLPEQVANKPQYPSMSLNIMVEAIIAAIEVIDADDNVNEANGTIC